MTQDKVIYCIRHGESTFNEWRKKSIINFSWIWVRDPMIVDAKLSTKGERQVKDLFERIQSETLYEKAEVIITSPLTRAIQTTLRGLPKINSPIIVDPLCREMLDTACDIGRQPSELRAEFKDENIDFSAVCMNWWMGSCTKDLPPCPPPDSFEKLLKLRENKEQLDERIHKFVHKLIALPHKHIVIVGHSSFFKRMLRMNRKLSNCEIYQASLQEICQGHGINWQGSIQK